MPRGLRCCCKRCCCTPQTFKTRRCTKLHSGAFLFPLLTLSLLLFTLPLTAAPSSPAVVGCRAVDG